MNQNPYLYQQLTHSHQQAMQEQARFERLVRSNCQPLYSEAKPSDRPLNPILIGLTALLSTFMLVLSA